MTSDSENTPSILAKFKPFLRGFHWLGLFHCNIKDDWVLHPTPLWVSFAKWVTYLFVLTFGFFAALWNLSRPDYTPGFLQCLQIALNFMFGPEKSSTLARISFISTPILTFLSGLLLAFSAPYLSNDLAHLEKHLKDFMPSEIRYTIGDLVQTIACSFL